MSLSLTIVSVVACAAAAGATSFMMLEQREERHFAASKAEELYTLIEAFDQSLIGYFSRVGAAENTENCPYKPADAGWSDLMRDSAKARMLISFYFPALWPQVKRVDAAIADCVTAMRRCQAKPRDEEAYYALDNALGDLRETMDALKHAVVTTHRDGARKRLRRRLLAPAGPVSMPA